MGKVIAKKIRGLNLWAKVALTVLFTLTLSVFMYEGWYKPHEIMAASVTYNLQVNSGTTVATGVLTDSSACGTNNTGAVTTLMDTSAFACASQRAVHTVSGAGTIVEAYFNSAYAVATTVTGTSFKVRLRDSGSGGWTAGVRLFYVTSSGTKTDFTGTEVTSAVASVGDSTVTLSLTGQSATVPVGAKLGIRVRATAGTSTAKRVYWGSTADTAGTGTSGVLIVNEVVAASNNANLSNLVLSSGTLTPTFSSTTTSYTASVANSVSSITVTPTEADTTATTTVNGVAVNSGTASGPISLAVGSNTITTVVTAQDGVTTKTYTVVVTRAGSSNADLSNLVLSSGTLSPAFSSATTSYTASVANSVSSITVTPTEADTTATTTVNGTAVNSGTASGPIALSVGANTITTVVTAQDGTTTKTYTVVVTRAAAASTNANLSNLVLSSGTLSPAFASGTISYTASVANPVASITVTPTVEDATATVKVNGTTVASGTASAPIALVVGSNTITTVVTAQDGTTTKTYTVTVTRAAAVNGTTAGALSYSGVTSNSITVTAPFTGDDNNNNSCVIKWGTVNGTYPNTATSAKSGSSYVATINNLAESTIYYFQATFTDADGRTPANGIVTGSTSTTAYVNPLMHSAANLDPSNAKGYGNWGAGKDCTWCHTAGTNNVKQVAQQIATPTGTRSVTFSRMTSTVTNAMDLFGNDQRSTLNRSTNICEVCHHQTNFHQYSSSVKSVGKSVTSNTHYNRAECIKCHPHNKGFKGNGHTVPLYATSAGHTDCSSGIGCHTNSTPAGTYPATGGTPPNCQSCHTKGDPLTANIGCGSCHGAAGGTGEPNGTVHPDVAGNHSVHVPAATNGCTTCHNIGGSGGNADHGPGNSGNTTTNPAVVNLDSALGWSSATSKCSSASCHGNVYSTTGSSLTPQWGTTNNGCSACHSAYPIGASGPATGGHGTHSAYACTNCHATGTSATAAPSVANGHTDGDIDIVNVGYQTNVTKHPANDGYSNRTCSTTCHGSPYGSGAGSTPAWGSTGAGCGACHNVAGAFITYSSPSNQKGPNTGSHSAHMNYGRYICDECHTGAVSNTVTQSYANAAHGDTDIDVTNQGYPANVAKHPANSGYSTCTLACHITTTWGLNTLKCTDCHAAAITRTKGRPGKQLAAVTAEFGKTYGHKKSTRTAVADADCIVCHLEGNFTTQKTSKYHADGNIDLRNPDGSGEVAITDNNNAAFTFQRFSTSFASGTRSSAINNTVASVITQKFCLTCHDSGGAANTTARAGTSPTPTAPFGGGYTVLNAFSQFDPTNSSKHPVRAARSADYPTAARLADPYKPTGTRGTSGTKSSGVIMSCFDCHNTGQTTGMKTLRTISAHGDANVLIRGGNATTNGTIYVSSPTHCSSCHLTYTYPGHNTGATGSAFTTTSGDMNGTTFLNCHYCHADANTGTRPARSDNFHGTNALPTTGATATVRWLGSAGTPAQVNTRPYAFIRNRMNLSNHQPRMIGSSTYSPQCSMVSYTGGACSNQSGKTYTVGGTY
ncbi:cytochrome c, 20 heme-binding sites [Geotalea daltonii FRC-32]|uniref:Cytochrome c, 20 heme-binding sites n=1 Tax=Geotalea daltonii (strain DSM 22248 / JCM 15807 / FRC-32) TaxID=316067 RepID=B9M506_GEODF|nr:cadherin-like beta sandwich domain-containing protein [Geotalea daltonii]ACM21690.1 cytochrome c, 20 heme-binding sites [Geotalea daltonii FRC-32]